jgi:integrase
MGVVKWYSVGRGLQATDHESRKYGKRFDRYCRGRYQVDGEVKTFGFGWESEWAAGEKARMLAEGDKSPRRSFLEYCQGELARLKQNAMKGQGPVTPKEDREEAKAKAEEEAKAKAEGERLSLTFGQYWDTHYLPAAKVSKPKSHKAEESLYKTWIKPNIGKMKVCDLRQLHFEAIKRNMVKAGKSPRTIQLTLAISRQSWNHARNNGIVSGDWPGKPVKAGRFDNKRLRFLNPDECENLLAKLKETSQQVHDMALLSLDTGLRAGEVFALDWEHVDLDNGLIHVVDTKSGKNRTAYMTDRVKAILEAMPEQQGFVFPSNTGERIGQISATFMRAVDDLKMNVGLTDKRNKATFHSLRHTFASRLVQSGVDLYVIKELMGHSTLALTERYSHINNANLKAAVRKLKDTEKPAQAKQKAKIIPMVSTA